MVISQSGRVGLLVQLRPTPRGACVKFRLTNRLHFYARDNLRRATTQEVVDAGYKPNRRNSDACITEE